MDEHFRLGASLLSLSVPAAGVAAFPVARAWLRRMPGRLPGTTAAALALAIALLWIEAGAVVLCFVHALTPLWISLWLGAGMAAAIGAAWRGGPWGWPDLTGVRLPLIAGGAILAILLLEATVPPWFQDDMVYHLSLARWFAQAHGYAPVDDNIFQAFPLGWESILAALHAFGRAPDHFAPFNPRLVTVWVAAGAALATAGLAEVAGAGRRAAAWCGVALLLVPTFAEFATLCYVESYLLLLAVLALTFVLRVLEGEAAFLPAGAVLAGACATVKYTGLGVCAGLLLLLAARAFRDRSRPAAEGLVRFTAIGAVTGCVFCVRNWLERGNPVFPLAFGTFGGRGWDDWRAVNYAGVLGHYGRGQGVADDLLLPFRLLAAHDTRAGFEASLGPLVAVGAIAGLVLLSGRGRALFPKPRAAAALGLFSAFWFLFWAATTQQGRMFLVAVPPLLALAVLGLAEARRRWPGPGRIAVLAAMAGVLLWAVPSEASRWSYQETSAWLAGRLDADRVLAMMLPDTYPMQRRIEALVPANAKVWLVWMHDYTYYLRRGFIEDQIFEDYRFSQALDASHDPAAFGRRLKEQGVGFVLLNHRFFLAEGSADTEPGRTDRLRERFARVLEQRALVPVAEARGVTLYAVR